MIGHADYWPVVLAGMTVHELFKACRERFLVTNELALRSHLNEFRDHQLVNARSGHPNSKPHRTNVEASSSPCRSITAPKPSNLTETCVVSLFDVNHQMPTAA